MLRVDTYTIDYTFPEPDLINQLSTFTSRASTSFCCACTAQSSSATFTMVSTSGTRPSPAWCYACACARRDTPMTRARCSRARRHGSPRAGNGLARPRGSASLMHPPLLYDCMWCVINVFDHVCWYWMS
jgi:hypothetical protein